MPKFKVYFQIYGRKLKATVEAKSETEARLKVVEKLQIDLVERIDELDDFPNIFKEIFGK
jgi:hypothetical protein